MLSSKSVPVKQCSTSTQNTPLPQLCFWKDQIHRAVVKPLSGELTVDALGDEGRVFSEL